MSVPTVVLRCGARGCQRKLLTIEKWPEAAGWAWSDRDQGIWVESCRRHGGVPTTMAELDERRDERGLPPEDRSRLMHFIRWSALRPAHQKACRTGRVVNLDVPPKGRTTL